MKNKLIIVITLITLIISSCSKEEGEGGRASITGKVYAKNYNASFTQLLSEYYAPEEEVYIIYGDNQFYDDKIKTDPNGVFEFKHLRKGNYTIFVYSKDTTFTIASGVEALYKSAEITNKEEIVELPDFEIIK
ncbi:MAG: hypothetical protein CO118_00695 [Flavobacteriales bacterium CG_4_9_14_3_um_filter_32_8]|nr:MAG: hypothetical protein CO118_00695 [Flavobacteriales bacterium CG_4_9_14_3_um_filter_32_8]